MLHDFHSFVPSRKGNNKISKNKTYRFVEDWIKTIVVFGACYITFITLIAEPYRIPTGSMEPTFLGIPDKRQARSNPNSIFNLFQGDHILAWKGISKFDKLRRGDIVAFIAIDNPNMFVIKRLVGLPGDKIRVKTPHVYINGKKLKDPPVFEDIKYTHEAGRGYPFRKPAYDYIIDVNGKFARDYRGKKIWARFSRNYAWGGDMEVTIPQKCYFVMGDNTRHSKDSRSWGWLPESHILGKASCIWFPFSRATSVEVNELFGD